MARYTLPSGDPQFFGSRGGSTFQRCGRVFSIRKRSAPVNKKSPGQTLSRNRFGAFASRWQQINVTQKATWTTNSPDYPRTDSLGNSYNVQGQALRVGANIAQFPAGASIINTLVSALAPTPTVPGTFEFDRGSNFFQLQISPDPVQLNCKAVFYIGMFSEAQRSFQLADCVRLGIVDSGGSTTAKNWFTAYTALFPGYPLTGNFFFPVICQIVQKSSGQVILAFQDWGFFTN